MRIECESKETYWGHVERARSANGLTLKRIFMRAGCQSSLEFHVRKHEIYWLVSGVLDVGLRGGRAINSSIRMHPGDCIEIIPGQMHMRKAVTDCVIWEACSSDDDDDGHIVEVGEAYIHKEEAA